MLEINVIEYYHLGPVNSLIILKKTYILVKWDPPPIGLFKLTIVGAFGHVSNNSGLGGVIRNHNTN